MRRAYPVFDKTSLPESHCASSHGRLPVSQIPSEVAPWSSFLPHHRGVDRAHQMRSNGATSRRLGAVAEHPPSKVSLGSGNRPAHLAGGPPGGAVPRALRAHALAVLGGFSFTQASTLQTVGST